jgi:antitoxin component YwqK of YwqJK toxin-antitoxin module
VPAKVKSNTMEVVNMLNTLPTVLFTDKILQFFDLTEVTVLRAIDKKIKHSITTHRHRICTKICFHILPHGVETLFSNGIVVKTTTFKEGIKHGEEKHFERDDGTLRHSLQFSEGQRHGQETHFYRESGGMTTLQFKHGQKHGVEKYFVRPDSGRLNEDGAMLLEVTPFKEGQKHGEVKQWSMHGELIKHRVLIKHIAYKEGKKHGVAKYFRAVEDRGFHPGAVLGQMIGVLVQATPFKEGLEHGEEKLWNNDGVLTKSTKFYEGQMVSSSSG